MLTAIVLTAMSGVWTDPDFGASYQAFEKRHWATRSSLEAEDRKHREFHRTDPAHAKHGNVSSEDTTPDWRTAKTPVPRNWTDRDQSDFEEKAHGDPVYIARQQFGHRSQSTHSYRRSRGYGASRYYYNNQYYNNSYGGYGYPYAVPSPYYYEYQYYVPYQPYYYNYYWQYGY